MKQIQLINQKHRRLLLFFAGWGADETPFKDYRPAASDYMLCYDYRTLEFDASHLNSYEEINVIGWSMGVWAATQTMPRLHLPVIRSIAINGTPFPIDEKRGIPPEIFHGTLERLTDVSLHKFLKRMCADGAAFRQFLQVTPRRPLEELREELIEIEKSYSTCSIPHFQWQQAVVGNNDRIIPPANQQDAWAELNTPVLATENAHYDEQLFKYYLQDLWTSN